MTRWGDRILKAHLAAQAKRAAAPAKRSKFNNVKVDQDGQLFDSRKEATRWRELEQLAAAGVIQDLKRQVRYILAPAVHLAGEAKKKAALRYYADFTYIENGQLVVEDAKSEPTRKLASYRNKKHLMATVHGIHIKEV
jgi:predicted polyphosphate/ATP-dependent NAD kinase